MYTLRVSASGARWQEIVEGVQVAGVDERATRPGTLHELKQHDEQAAASSGEETGR